MATPKSLVGKPAHNRLPPGEAAFRRLFGAYKDRAELKKRDFTLTREEFQKLTKQNCFYCGRSPSSEFKSNGNPKKRNSGSYIYNGIDRVDNRLGIYIK